MKTTLNFEVKAAGKTFTGTITCPDDDGTTHLPMMVHSALKLIAEGHPEVTSARSISISASFEGAPGPPFGDSNDKYAGGSCT